VNASTDPTRSRPWFGRAVRLLVMASLVSVATYVGYLTIALGPDIGRVRH
jgi:hypothetical protein